MTDATKTIEIAKITNGQFANYEFAKIARIPSRNICREGISIPQISKLVGSIREGWDAGLGTCLVGEVSQLDVETGMLEFYDELSNLDDEIKIQVDGSPVTILKSKLLAKFDAIYRPKKGKFVKFDGESVSGNQRLTSILFTLCYLDDAKVNSDHLNLIPVQSKNYLQLAGGDVDKAIRLRDRDCMTTNTKVETGQAKLSSDNCLAAARTMYYRVGSIQGDLRKAFNDNNGQKFWPFFKLDARFPELALYERCMADDDDLKISGLKPAKLAALQADKFASVQPETGPKEFIETTAEMVLEYVNTPKAYEEKIATKAKIIAARDKSQCKLVRATLQAVLDDKIEKFVIDHNVNAPEHNAIYNG